MELESPQDRIRRIASMVARGGLPHLLFAVWMRWRRLEFGYADEVPAEAGNSHQHSGGPILDKVLRHLQVHPEAVAVDMGVGMGIAAFTLSRHFSRVIGVDLSPGLIATARRNLERLRVRNVDLHCADARHFTTGLDEVTHLYMFNPFPASVMSDMLVNVNRSLAHRPRELTIIYKHPVCHATILESGFTHTESLEFRHSHPFAIYKKDTNSHAYNGGLDDRIPGARGAH